MQVKKTPQLGRFFILKCAYLLALASLAIGWLSSMHVQPWMSWHSEAAVFFGVFSAATLVLLSNLKASAAVGLPKLAIPALLLFVICVLQWWAGRLPYAGDVWIVLFYVSLCVACLVLGYAAGGKHQLSEISTPSLLHTPPVVLAGSLLLIGLASAGAGLVQTFDVWTESDWFVRVPGNEFRPGGQEIGRASCRERV